MSAAQAPGRSALITGATSGLGEALALRLAGDGWRVAVTGRNPEKLKRSAERVAALGGEVLEIPLEVTRSEDFDNAAAVVEERWGSLDLLVNNAGIAAGAPLEDWTVDAWRHTLDVNLWSVVYGCKAFGPLLEKGGGGHVVNIASLAAIIAAPEMASYSVSKAGVVALSETLHGELAQRGIGVTVCCPGVFQSDLLNPDKVEPGDRGERILNALEVEIEQSRLTSEHVADHVLRCVRRNRLYCVPGFDARALWLSKRYFPEWSRKLLVFLYRKRLWRFANLDS